MNKPYVFISYSTKQQQEADALYALIKYCGLSAWMAPNDIPIGGVYAAEIGSAIEECSGCVLLLTEDSQNSVFVSKEVEMAISCKKKILPVKMGQVNLNPEFKFYIGNCQIVSVNEVSLNDSGMCKALVTVAQLLGKSEFLLPSASESKSDEQPKPQPQPKPEPQPQPKPEPKPEYVKREVKPRTAPKERNLDEKKQVLTRKICLALAALLGGIGIYSFVFFCMEGDGYLFALALIFSLAALLSALPVAMPLIKERAWSKLIDGALVELIAVCGAATAIALVPALFGWDPEYYVLACIFTCLALVFAIAVMLRGKLSKK